MSLAGGGEEKSPLIRSLAMSDSSTGTDDLWTPESSGDDGLWSPSESGGEGLAPGEEKGGLWVPPGGEEEEFIDKGEAPEAVPETKKYDLIMEHRSTGYDKRVADPEMGLIPDNLEYIVLYSGITSQTSFMLESEQYFYDATENEEASDSGWAKFNFTKLFDNESRLDAEIARLWSSDGSTGYRSAVTYGWPVGLNMDLSTRFQYADAMGNASYQVEVESQFILTPTTAPWVKGYYYWDEADTDKFQLGVGLAQYLGMRTALHFMAYLSDVNAVEPPDITSLTNPLGGPVEASSASYRIELRHRVKGWNTLLKAAYYHYFDSWYMTADGYTVSFKQPVIDYGWITAGYRLFNSSEGLNAGTFIIGVEYKWGGGLKD